MPVRTTEKAALLVLALLVCAGRGATEEREVGPAAGRVEVGKCISADGTIFRREAPEEPWHIVKQGEALHAGELLLGLPGAVIDSHDGSVQLTFRGNLRQSAAVPIIESAVLLHASKDGDLDFTIDRGQIEFANRKDRGDAKVVSRARDYKAEITMEPGAVCSVGAFGRWLTGVPFRKNARADYAPMLHLVFLVLKGEVTLQLDGTTLAMNAPPGPAMIEWDSVYGADPSPQRLDRVPAWATSEGESVQTKRRRALLDQFRQTILKTSIEGAIDEFLSSDDSARRRMAINFMGATDDLGRLAATLANGDHADVREWGILALRHWIGRGPGQDQKLFERLLKTKGYTPVDAETCMELLHSFGEAEVSRPELYETLIDYLGHEKLAIRDLAYWHLVRLTPAGAPINYDPQVAEESRNLAIARWRKLIPPGKMPPNPQPAKP
jgi:hypothetical protein